MGKRIAIAAIGTHGDIRPFVALARALIHAGHDPVIGAPSDFQGFIAANGVEFFDFGGDMQALLGQGNFDAAMQKHSLSAMLSAAYDGFWLHYNAARTFPELARGADALVYHMNTTHALDVAGALGIPAIMALFQPLLPTREHAYIAGIGPKLPAPFDPLSYLVLAAQQSFYDLPRYLLRPSVGYGRFFRTGFAKALRAGPVPTIHAYPEAVSPRPKDWPDNALVTGAWRLDEHPEWQIPADLQVFLDEGEAPVYIGFGSMSFGSARNEAIIREALEFWSGRAVLARGWGGLGGAEVPRNCFLLDKAPHDKLFPLMRAVVHHGGAGTTLAGLTAGRPSFVVPQFFDQPYWGERVHALGCGPEPVLLKHLTGRRLADGLEALVCNTDYAEAARRLGDTLDAEDGAGTAVKRIEALVDAS
ncbi:MAG: glycosyltransferase [Alphaproteobacteria bacterium]|nr:glycosyltransferase [Alphaproteobacteria bacterium]